MHFKNAINSFSQRAYEIQFISSDQTQKHSPIAAAAESFLPFNFTSATIWFIEMKFQTSDRKLWRESLNIESSFCFFVAKNEPNYAYVKNSQQSTCFYSDIPNSMTTQGSRCRYASCSEFYANIYTQSDTTEHMKICCSIVSRWLTNCLFFLSVWAHFASNFCSTFSLHFRVIRKFSLNWCGVKVFCGTSLIKATRNLRLQTIARNWSWVGVRSWKLFCSLCCFIGNERWV
jgi:hypothetical protein